MELLRAFGPRVAKYKLSESESKSLLEICNPMQMDATETLVGYIKEEKFIGDSLRRTEVFNTLKSNIQSYIKEVDSGYFDKDSDIVMDSAWYNKQIALEYNPPHCHYPICDIVCVIFSSIHIDENAESYKNNSNTEQQGQLHLTYGEVGLNGFGTARVVVEPEEGDMFVFPSTLIHYTSPVLGNSERYSISCNWKFASHG